jgi:hypothetical protein
MDALDCSVMDSDPDPDPKQEMHLIKNHQKINNLKIMTLKNVNLTFSLKVCFQMPWKCLFYCWHCKERIFSVGSASGSVTIN